jgi:ribulose-phosphate 3-epimerase
MSVIIAPSILSADLANLQAEIEMINDSSADWIHFDVMDGIFVPNISFGMPVCQAINQYAKKPLDVHLMIEHPEKYLKDFQKAGAHSISVHYEACVHLHRTIQEIKTLGCKASVAINPHTPVHLLDDILPELDMVLVMSVNPGYSGQSFITHTYQKVSALKALIQQKGTKTLIEVDGGVNNQNAPELLKAGANVLVSASYIFGSSDPKATIHQLKQSTPSYQA